MPTTRVPLLAAFILEWAESEDDRALEFKRVAGVAWLSIAHRKSVRKSWCGKAIDVLMLQASGDSLETYWFLGFGVSYFYYNYNLCTNHSLVNFLPRYFVAQAMSPVW